MNMVSRVDEKERCQIDDRVWQGTSNVCWKGAIIVSHTMKLEHQDGKTQ